MLLADKVRTLRETEGQLRGLGRALSQGELVKAIRQETGQALSQSYLSQIESGARPHLTNTTRLLLASFFKVHPGYLVDDPEGYHAELLSDLRSEATLDAKLDAWLVGGAERFRRDPALHSALVSLAMHPESRACLLLLEGILQTPGLAGQLADLLRPELQGTLRDEQPNDLTQNPGTSEANPHTLDRQEAQVPAARPSQRANLRVKLSDRPSASPKPKSRKTIRGATSSVSGACHAR